MLKPKRAALKVQRTGLQPSSRGLAPPPPLSPYRHGARPQRSRSGLPLVALRQADHTFLAVSQFKYKLATETVAEWLEKTAKACGYPMDPPQTDISSTTTTDNDNTSQASEELEGNAGELAQERDDITSATEKYPHKVALNQFVSLADFIAAASSPPVSVPKLIIKALDRAINIRREHGQHLRQSRPREAELLPAFQQHEHFISVLEHVREVLRPRMTTGQSKNKLKYLNVREPSEWSLPVPDVTLTTESTTATPEANYEADLRQHAEEAYLGFDLLMQDYRSLRTVIFRAWAGYQRGNFDLVTVSLVTNSAFGIARRLQRGVQKLFDKHGGSSQMLSAFYVASCKVYGEDPDFREQPDDDMNFQTYDLADSMMVPTFMVLQSFDALVEPGSFLPYELDSSPPCEPTIILPCEPGSKGTCHSVSDRSMKSAREKFQEDKVVLVRILSRFLFFHGGVPPQPFEDELTKGLRVMLDTHEIPVWLVFAAQVFLDTHHALGGNVKKGLKDLMASARPIEASVKKNFEFHPWPTISKWPKDMFKFMTWNPLFCGMFSYSLKCRYQELGLEGQAGSGSFMHSAHLHNIVCNEELIRPRSLDMDLVMSSHEETFVGDVPCKPQDQLR